MITVKHQSQSNCSKLNLFIDLMSSFKSYQYNSIIGDTVDMIAITLGVRRCIRTELLYYPTELCRSPSIIYLLVINRSIDKGNPICNSISSENNTKYRY